MADTNGPSAVQPARPAHARWRGADNARGMAVLAVFLVHLMTVLNYPQMRGVINFCRFGSDLFMVLSGCLIYHSLRSRSVGYFAFLVRRIQRIYPVFACILVVYVCLSLVLPAHSKLPVHTGPAIAAILENAAIFPIAFGVTPLITVTWTLSYICVFYVFVYPLAKWTGSWPVECRAGFWSVVTVLVYFVAGKAFALPLGVLVAELMENGGAPWWMPAAAVGVLVRPIFGGTAGTLFGGIAAMAICCCLLPGSTPAFMRFLSRISYSFYLTHGLVILGAAAIPISRWMVGIIAFPASVGISYLVFRLVEEPSSPLTQSRRRPLSVPLQQLRLHSAAPNGPGSSEPFAWMMRRWWISRRVKLVFAPGSGHRQVRLPHERIEGHVCALVGQYYFPVVRRHAFLDLNLAVARVCLGCGAVHTKLDAESSHCSRCIRSRTGSQPARHLAQHRPACECSCGHDTRIICWNTLTAA